MKNYFYANEISAVIKDILTGQLTKGNEYNLIEIGDLSVLPQPDELEEELPAILICMNSVDVTTVNKTLEIFHHRYNYSLHYIYYVDIKSGRDYKAYAVKNTELIAGILTELFTLNNFNIPRTDGEAGGWCCDSEVSGISFDNAETEFFRNLEIDAAIGIITYTVDFRTYERRKQ